MIYLHADNSDKVHAYGDEESIREALGISEEDPIPEEVAKISEKDWEDAGYVASIISGEIVLGPSLESLKAYKSLEIKGAADKALEALSIDYPYKEVLSFASQEAEARTVLKDPSTPTPLLTPMAARRGISVEDLAQKVIAKADAATAATGDVLGQAQRDRDRLAAAQTIEEVKAIIPSYTLPEVRK